MVKTRKPIRRCVSFLLSVIMVLSFTTPIAYATSVGGPTLADFDHNAKQGETTGGEDMEGGYGWGPARQGFRVSLLSGNSLFPSLGARAVADIVYSNVPNNKVEMKENRLGQTSRGTLSNTIGSGELHSLSGMPPSLTAAMAANGIAVREYLLGGAGGSGGGQGNPGGGGSSGPVINWTNTSGGGGGGSTTGNNGSSISADERNDAQQVINTWKNRLSTYSCDPEGCGYFFVKNCK